MPTFESDLSVPKLTPAERKWITQFDELLGKMPKRLYLFECADTLSVIDRNAARLHELNDGQAARAGIVLAHLDNGTFACTSASG